MYDSKKNIDMLNYVGMKKHFNQMTKKEVDTLKKRIKGINNWRMTKHATKRGKRKQRGGLIGLDINQDMARKLIKSSIIVNYEIKLNKSFTPVEQVMVKSRLEINNKSVFIVLSLTDKIIPTIIVEDVRCMRSFDKNRNSEDLKIFA